MGQLASVQITTAQTGVAQTAIPGFGEPIGVELDAHFTYGSGGTSVDAYVQTSTDGGATWWDIANFHFTTATANTYQNLVGSTAVNASANLANLSIAANTSINGLLGDRYRVVMTTVGTYANTTLAINITPRY